MNLPSGRSPNLMLILAREPCAGMTKTRLGKGIGMEVAACLYRAFLADLAAHFTPPAPPAVAPYDLGWAYTPAECDFRAVLAGLCGDALSDHVGYVQQDGDGLGERQANLLRWSAGHGYEQTVLIASDSPQLPRSVADEAFTKLTNHDVVIGRVLDGGYYLIGVRGFHDVITGVPMSTGNVADTLCARAEALGLSVGELPLSFDVDEASDLVFLRDALAPDGAAASTTWTALRNLGLTGGSREDGSRQASGAWRAAGSNPSTSGQSGLTTEAGELSVAQ